MIISGNIIYQQEGYYFRKILLQFSFLKFIASLIISIRIVDFIHTVQMHVAQVPGNEVAPLPPHHKYMVVCNMRERYMNLVFNADITCLLFTLRLHRSKLQFRVDQCLLSLLM